LKNLLYSIASGLLLWLSWPTYGFAGFLFIAFIPLLLLERNLRTSGAVKTGKKVWFYSYLAFVVWNFTTTYWLYFSTPFGMFFAVLVNALLMSLVFLGYHFVAKRASQGAALSFLVSFWILFEYLHLNWEFSWPWLNLGNGFSENVDWVQWYEYTGTFGGSLWIWVVNVTLFLWWFRFRESENKSTRSKFKGLFLAAIFIVVPLTISLFIKPDLSKIDQSTAKNVLIVQPNIDPYAEKFYQDNNSVVDSLIVMLDPVINEETDIVITPETMLAADLRITQVERDDAIKNLRGYFAQFPQTSYLGGVSLLDVYTDPSRKTTQTNTHTDGRTFYDLYNSALFFNPEQPLELYHKSKLVVGVENFPYKSILEPLLGDVMLDMGGTSATKTTQKERANFRLIDSTAVAPIICYESVYGEYVTGYVNNGAQFLAVITNDGWWEETQGHKQHLSLSRLRAIENRRYVARSANTGISAIINSNGEIIKSLGYNKKGILSGTIIPQIEMTFYATHGDYIVRIAAFIALFTFLFSILKKGTMKRK